VPGWWGRASLQPSTYRPPTPSSSGEAAHSTEVAATGTGVSGWAIANDAGVGVGTLYRHFPSLTSAIRTLLAAGAAAGTVRTDVEPGDVLASLSGISLTVGEPSQRARTRRLLDLLTDGLRYGSGPAIGRP
jgi:hypothetical protein